MPRRRAPPRLYLDRKRGQWVIRDGPHFIRTGCPERERGIAETALERYLGHKHRPEPSPSPLIADVLSAYAREHLPHTRAAANAAYQVEALAAHWGDKSVADVTARACRAYASTKSPAAARRDLETLRAAIRYWHREYGPLASIPAVTLPERPIARTRWLTRSEAARLLWAARHTPHLRRFILLGLYTGSRSGVILALQWSQIDLAQGVMARTAPGTAADKRKRAPIVRLGKRILAHLRRWRRLDNPAISYLCHYDGARVRKLRRSWTGARVRAGLDPAVTPHTLRHTRATWMMQSGTVTPWEAAGALGMSLEMLERTYGHHHPDWQRAAAEA